VFPVLGDRSGLGLGELVEDGDERVLDEPGMFGAEAGLAGRGLRADSSTVGGAAVELRHVGDGLRLEQQEHVVEAGLRQLVDAVHRGLTRRAPGSPSR